MNQDYRPSLAIQHELEASRHILKAIFDSTKSSIFFIDPDYRILFFNKWARDGSKFLYGRDMFIGDSILNYRQGDDNDIASIEFKQDFKQAIESKSLVIRERQMQHPTISYWVNMEYTPVFDADKLVGVLLHVQNISERKKIEDQMAQQHLQLAQIAWIQSHETRQPVATMLGLINILDKQSLTPDNLSIVKMMEETTQKLDKVIQKMVLLASQISPAEYR
jgi:PAS domain S-box-containing protein